MSEGLAAVRVEVRVPVAVAATPEQATNRALIFAQFGPQIGFPKVESIEPLPGGTGHLIVIVEAGDPDARRKK